jgi:hypothetical protein
MCYDQCILRFDFARFFMSNVWPLDVFWITVNNMRSLRFLCLETPVETTQIPCLDCIFCTICLTSPKASKNANKRKKVEKKMKKKRNKRRKKWEKKCQLVSVRTKIETFWISQLVFVRGKSETFWSSYTVRHEFAVVFKPALNLH